jgi:hypothetical protein
MLEEVLRRSLLPAQDRSKRLCFKGMLQQINSAKWGTQEPPESHSCLAFRFHFQV